MQSEPTAPTQPARAQLDVTQQARPRPLTIAKRRQVLPLSAVLLGLLTGVAAALYLFAPLRTNTLILGVDTRLEGTALGRSDTMILTSVIPLRPDVHMLSIPRDLWVDIPGYGENRINTAHFFAENEKAGTGPAAAMDVVRSTFGIDVHYYVRVQFDGFKAFVNALGGVEVEFDQPTIGLAPGVHVLNGDQALALVRDRTGDDFFRMAKGQLFLRALMRQLTRPSTWPRLPAALATLPGSVDTDVPIWEWPRLGLALLRAGPNGIDARTIRREMVVPVTTNGGAQVLVPNWAAINPLLLEMFGQ